MILAADVIAHLRPNTPFVVNDNDPTTVVWHVEDVSPIDADEYQHGIEALLADEQAKASARKTARDSAIARFKNLGFTDAEIDTLVLPA